MAIRILTTKDVNVHNFLHGHHSGKAGICFYNDNYRTPNQNNTDNVNNWVVTCGKNTSGQSSILINGIERGNTNNLTSKEPNILTINIGGYGEKSDWALSHVFIWGIHLNNQEMKLVSDVLMQYLRDGVSLTTLFPPP